MSKTAIVESLEVPKQSTAMDLLSIALQKDAAIDVIERLAALQEKALARQDEICFNEALNHVQSDIKRIAADLENPQTRSKYASYAALDRVIRPVYSKAGFSLSFDTTDCPLPEHVRVLCYVSLGGHTRRYQVDMPSDGKGAKGGDVMTKTHATGSAMSYGMRYLLKGIFNIAVGEDDDDGNQLSIGDVAASMQRIQDTRTGEELKAVFKEVYTQAEKAGDKNAMKQLIAARAERIALGKQQKAQAAQKATATTKTPSEPPKAPKTPSTHNWAKLHASAAERGITHEEIAKFYRRKFHVEHGRDLDAVQFALVCREVETWQGPEIT